MKYWFDTEFIDDGKTIDLISIGIIAEDGRKYYSENSDCDHSKACEWVKTNVISLLIPKVHGRSKLQIKQQINDFIGLDKPEFWAWYGAYDWVAMSQLFGRMIDVPRNWPHMVMDVRQLSDIIGNPKVPEQTTTKHHALNDAIWTKETYEFLKLNIEKSKR